MSASWTMENGVIAFDHVSNRASSEWLTSVLTENGHLHSGSVVAVDQRVSRIGTTLTSTFYQLDIEYSADFQGTAPSSCLMKVGKPECFAGAKKEARFYERARRSGSTKGLVTTFATAVDDSTKSALILLGDRTDCSSPSAWPLPPDIALCERAIRSLATWHARWWNSAELTDPPFKPLTLGTDPEGWSKLLLSPFYEALGDGLSRSRREILEKVTEWFPRMVHQRVGATSFQTLVHGDAHYWNFLYPANPSAHPILIDWQSFFVFFGAYDLAYMIALHWFPERRQRFERMLLHAYHDELCTHEIDYSFDDLWFDYRIQVAGLIIDPVVQCVSNVPAAVWWPHLDRAFSAFDDLDCREFL